MIVAVEGMDGVGKTTVAKYIQDKYKLKYVKEPLSDLFNLSKDDLLNISEVVFKCHDERIIAWYLALGDAFALSKYHDDNIIMDRHVLLNYFWNGTDASEEIFNLEQRMFGKPDLTILLYASPQERRKRIEMRNPHDPDLKKDKMWIDGYDKMIDYLKRYDYNYILVDTDDLSMEETLLKIDDIIKKYNLKNNQ